jgi:ribose 5-phosphate isomerase B
VKVLIAADHAGFELKNDLKAFLESLGYEMIDLGALTYEALDDYPDFAYALAKALVGGEGDRGVLICGSGIGASIAANKVKGVRAGVCAEPYSAHQGVEHDDVNVVVIGSRVTGIEVAKEIVKSFLGAEFSGEERHVRRLNKVLEIEAAQCATASAFGDSPH